ncbi:MAG TPA: alpha-1,2-fucosyltransferase [Pyrinomonadaceae bacterium]|nr:alpha-1,2-fucosyltransferase [Pyrinomonadaceae bacterium]
MVITKLIGGLGNQFFQYAVGRALSVKNGVPLKLDVSAYESYKLRRYSLSHFNVVEEIASPDEIERFRRPGPNRLVRLGLRLGVLPDSLRFTTVVERGFPFDPEVLSARGNVYLEGYWQSEKYFKEIEDVIRRELTVKHEPDPVNAEVGRAITGADSVCVHVRRGDYVENPEMSKIYEQCTPDYYHAAARELAKSVAAPHFFVFSDDPRWARENLEFNHPVTYVDHNGGGKDYEDLRLMSLCKHFVIANSSFSWWGAWLGSDPRKVVFAPKAWFRTREHDTRDLIPDAWYVI